MEKTIKRISITVVLAMVMIFGLASIGLANGLPPATAFGTPDSTKMDSFIVTVSKLEVSTDGGTTWIVVWSTDKPLDIALANVGEKAGNFAAGLNVPAGTYNAYRITIGQVFTIKGVVQLSATADGLAAGWYYTRAAVPRKGIRPMIQPSAGFAATEAAARAAADFSGVATNSPGGSIVYTGTLDFTVSVGGTAYFQVNFNLANKLGLYSIQTVNGITYTPYIFPQVLVDADFVITY